MVKFMNYYEISLKSRYKHNLP